MHKAFYLYHQAILCIQEGMSYSMYIDWFNQTGMATDIAVLEGQYETLRVTLNRKI